MQKKPQLSVVSAAVLSETSPVGDPRALTFSFCKFASLNGYFKCLFITENQHC